LVARVDVAVLHRTVECRLFLRSQVRRDSDMSLQLDNVFIFGHGLSPDCLEPDVAGSPAPLATADGVRVESPCGAAVLRVAHGEFPVAPAVRDELYIEYYQLRAAAVAALQ